jgi:hypothetical protein
MHSLDQAPPFRRGRRTRQSGWPLAGAVLVLGITLGGLAARAGPSDTLRVFVPGLGFLPTIPLDESPDGSDAPSDTIQARAVHVAAPAGLPPLPILRQTNLTEPGTGFLSDVALLSVTESFDIDPLTHQPIPLPGFIDIEVTLQSADLSLQPPNPVAELATGNDLTYPLPAPFQIIAFSCTEDDSPGACSCACSIVPEPSSLALLLGGFSFLVGHKLRDTVSRRGFGPSVLH